MTNLQKAHYYLKDLESPSHFISWDFLYLVSSCLGRRVHLQSQEFGVYPNIFLIIVADPAVGKSLPAKLMMRHITDLSEMDPKKKELRHLVKITPTCVTLEALYEFIETATTFETVNDKPYCHASVSFALCDEMALLFKSKEGTNDITNFLHAGYDCAENFFYKTKKSGENNIKNMCVNFLGCCTPDWVRRSMSADLIGEGFTSRAIFLWGDKRRQKTTFLNFEPEQRIAVDSLKNWFRQLTQLKGQVTMTDKALKFFHDWYQSDESLKIINKDPKLVHYYSRKKIHVMKLAMLCHFAERTTMTLDVHDFKNALSLLNAAELHMHKALAISSRNPLAAIADQIKKVIYDAGTQTFMQILVKTFTSAHGGNRDEIDQAIKFLMDTQQIKLISKGYILTADANAAESTDSSGDLPASDASNLQAELPPNFLPESDE